MNIEISVIIPTLNRDKLLNRTLESLTKQHFPKHFFEVIVIDNGSKDETANICNKYRKKIMNFKYIYNDTPGLLTGRHVGLKESKGKILAYIDDDIYALSSWLQAIYDTFKDEEVVLVGGNNIPEYEIDPPKWIEKMWNKTKDGIWLGEYSILNFGNEVKSISPFFIWGCNFSIRKNILIKIGGFNPDSMPNSLQKYIGDGETAVSSKIDKLNKKVIFNPKASVYHYVSKERMTLEYINKRNYIQGIMDSYSLVRKSKKIDYYRILESKIRFNNMINESFTDELELSMKKYYYEGFLYHQMEVYNDDTLLKWITRNDYLNNWSI